MSGQDRNNRAISCSTVTAGFSPFLDGQLSDSEHRRMDTHFAECAGCSAELRQLRQIRASIRRMPVQVPPAGLNTRLRVMASRELAKQKTTASFPAMWADWRVNYHLWAQNLMRPLAIPTAGGFLSALLLFCLLPLGMLSPTLAIPVPAITDVPTGLYTEASVKTMNPLGVTDEDVVVELTIDDQGRILSYSIPDCPHMATSPGLRRNIESNLLFTQFTPATMFGQPMSGKIRLSFRNSTINVKG